MPHQAGLFQIVTFATHPFRGNPAFVLCDTGGASDAILAGMCDMLGTGIIAVIDDLALDQPLLRFFTPEGAHPGAGHATLAAAHVALRCSPGKAREALEFRLPGGERRSVRAEGSRIAVDFPIMPALHVDRIDEVEAALGVRPTETWVSPFGYTAVFEDAATIAALRPDMARVAALDRAALIATAPGGAACDIVIRVFAPNVGLPEDPVCGTAHRIIVPYWAQRLGKATLHSRHLSSRGGDLWCENRDHAVVIAGDSHKVVAGAAELPDS